ncbi:MAG: hypothetical protein H0V53_05595 [Rubrobacter sp.]|nr:hypothetical protein [Rubrobacter sp.]
MGLIQSVIESSGIPTTSVTLLREVTEKVDPPRALFADYPLGYPLGAPDDPELQRSIVEASLSLLTATDSLPRIESFSP